MKRKIILDVDTGGDDAVATLLAGHHPALELVAVAVTHGNAPLTITLDNTLRVLEAGGLSRVPVYPGADRPLVADPLPGDAVQRAILPLPAPTLAPQTQHAALFLVDYYMSLDGPSTIYAPTGPQTNLALALRLEPRLAARIPRIVTMAGAYLEGNCTPSAEFNVVADPEAARVVFNAGIPITMVGLEVTGQARITPHDVARMRACNTPSARIAADIIDFINTAGWSAGEIYDACAVAALIEPPILTTKAMRVDIELRGELTRGRTVADISGRQKKEPNVDVGVGINRGRFIEIMLEGLGSV
ncbi:MAG: nucleoside hydrolase [Chloroflexi bacterium]|nr:nucleoside hydrolase [Chloroflexota bacterium]